MTRQRSTPPNSTPSPSGGALLPYLAGAFAVAIWGLTPAATAFVARDIQPGLVGVARLLTAGLLLVPIVAVLRPPFPAGTQGRLVLLAGGVIGFAASFVLQGVGVARTTTAHAALVFAAAPILTGVLQFALARAWPRPLWWVGCAISVVGEAVLIAGRDVDGGGEPTVVGDLVLVVATLTVSVGYVAGARLSRECGLFGATAWSILVGAVAVLPAAPLLLGAVGGLTPVGWTALTVLVVLCTIGAYAAWFWALDRGGAASIAPMQFAQPLTSLLIAGLFLAERLPWTLGLAMALILSGVWVTRRSR